MSRTSINARSIAAYARKQLQLAHSEAAAAGNPLNGSSLGAVRKVRVSSQDPTLKMILEMIKQ